MKSKVLLIVPAYNEELNIEKVVGNLIRNFPQLDYVVVNDGSKDRTAEICRKNGFNFIDLPINLGLAGAFRGGVKYADYMGYEYALQFDGDGQHDPSYIGKLLETAERRNSDIVIGSRFVTQKKPRDLRMIGSRLISACIYLTTGKRIKDPTSGMRLYNRKMIRRLAKEINYGPEPDTIAYLIRCGAKVSECQVSMNERTAGESYLNLTNSIKYMARMISSILVVQWFRKRVQ